VRSDIADYYFEVQRWDRDVADAMKLLEKAGVLENTIIVMTGDHGMPFPRCKGNLYDWGSRVPLAIRWGQGIKNPGREVTDFVSLTDLAPTFLSAAGVEVPDVMTGRSLLPILQSEQDGRVQAARDHVVFGRERHADCQEGARRDILPERCARTSICISATTSPTAGRRARPAGTKPTSRTPGSAIVTTVRSSFTVGQPRFQ
jgi:N-sulfoglucosamine sulfohydrolase